MGPITDAPVGSVVGEVPTFWRPLPGPLHAALSFRVGWADEPLPWHGATHLVEHLVLTEVVPPGADQPAYEWNGATGAEFTTFYCTGTADEVCEFLDAVTRGIRRLPVDRLAVQRRLLRAEACNDDAGLAALHDVWRWGSGGPGRNAFPEYGLGWLGPDELHRWAAEHFTAGNAALLLTGPPPPALTLDLPPGTRRPLPTAPPRVTRLPAHVPGDAGTVSFSAELHRDEWSGLVTWVVQRALTARLRYADGITYSVQTAHEDVGPDLRRLVVRIDGLPEHLDAVAQGAAEVMLRLAREPAAPSEIDAWRRRMHLALDSDEARAGELSARVREALTGEPYASAREPLDDPVDASAERARASIERMLPTMLWCLPAGVDIPAVGAAPQGSAGRVTGRRFIPARGRVQDEYLQVSDVGLTLVQEGHDAVVTVPWAECTAVAAYEDGRRVVVGADGFRINVVPAQWRRARHLVNAIDRHTPLEAWAPQEPPEADVAPVQPRAAGDPRQSMVAMAVLGLATWLLAALLVVAAFADEFQLSIVLAASVFLALGAWPVRLAYSGACVRRGGAQPWVTVRWRGVRRWSTRTVVTVMVACTVTEVAVAAVAGVFPLWFAAGAVVTGREAWRRARR